MLVERQIFKFNYAYNLFTLGANLKGVDMEGSQMTGINLRVATLKNAKLKNCNLRGATLAGTDLEVSHQVQSVFVHLELLSSSCKMYGNHKVVGWSKLPGNMPGQLEGCFPFSCLFKRI